MSFRFSLATLLRLREIAEQREERLLAQVEQQMAQSRQMLADLALQREGEIRRREEVLHQSISAVDLVDSHVRVGSLRDLESNGRAQLAKLKDLHEQQMKIYQTARRSSEVLSEMRDDQRDAFYKEQVKQEQSAMDDNFSSRRRLK